MSKQHKLGLSGPVELLGTNYDPGSQMGWIDIGFRVYVSDLDWAQEMLTEAMKHAQEIRLIRKQIDGQPPAFVMFVTEDGYIE